MRTQTSVAIADRCDRLRNRPLAVVGAGVPSKARIITVHTCHQAHQEKPSFCSCAEKVTESSAHELIKLGVAEWDKSDRKTGETYTWRRAIVFTKNAEKRFPVDPNTGSVIFQAERNLDFEIVSAAFKAMAEQGTITQVAKTQSDGNKDKQRKRRETRAINAAVRNVFRKLHPEEELKIWDDQEIIKVFEGRTEPREFAERVSNDPARCTRIVEILQAGQKQFWNAKLSGANLTIHRGTKMEDSPKARGQLVILNGRTQNDIEQILAHREENEDGIHKATGANFKPGAKDEFGNPPIYNCDGDPEAYCEKQIESVMSASDFGWSQGQREISSKLELNFSKSPVKREEDPDVFTLADHHDAIEQEFNPREAGATWDEAKKLESDFPVQSANEPLKEFPNVPVCSKSHHQQISRSLKSYQSVRCKLCGQSVYRA
jgi:hypothetical protein